MTWFQLVCRIFGGAGIGDIEAVRLHLRKQLGKLAIRRPGFAARGIQGLALLPERLAFPVQSQALGQTIFAAHPAHHVQEGAQALELFRRVGLGHLGGAGGNGEFGQEDGGHLPGQVRRTGEGGELLGVLDQFANQIMVLSFCAPLLITALEPVGEVLLVDRASRELAGQDGRPLCCQLCCALKAPPHKSPGQRPGFGVQ